MKLLLIAPHPFYQERGTPIAVDLLLRVLSERLECIDLVTFHEGAEIIYPNVRYHRIQPPAFLNHIRPGFSLKKIMCDWYLFRLCRALIKKRQYDLIHAIEEGAFIALYFNRRRRIPFVYDMDSHMSDQLVEKMPWLGFLQGFFRWAEGKPIARAIHVMPMCQQLADFARIHGQQHLTVLRDVSLLNQAGDPSANPIDIRDEYGLEGPILMYIGNLEHYQGIDLLLEAAALSLRECHLNLIVIGGNSADIDKYRNLSKQLSIEKNVLFLGPQPVSMLGGYMSQADILASPRSKGSNTPMKIYSYMDSGKAILATNKATHTQVLSDETARLCAAEAPSMAAAIKELLDNPAEAARLAANAQRQVHQEHSFERFRSVVNEAYDTICQRLPDAG